MRVTLDILSGHLADPQGANPIVAAVAWLEGTLLGTVATAVAVVAIASVGLAMLGARLDLRRGATVIMGCFILFGASSIVAGVRSASASFGGDGAQHVAIDESPPIVVPPSKPRKDPYAGASLLP
ncbi:TrbC/VirB2 family protein [Sphingomonas sp. AOB5]|uniref:TrbC/VirB2 family protein n=1 Tax=Sphingomonas sp. AOB5 TaxID=3034017 RepID=UPI003211F588